MRKIETIRQLESLIGETYIYAVIVSIVALIIAFIIGNMVKYDGGKKAKDHIRRRIWFIVIAVLSTLSFFLYNSLYVGSYVTKVSLSAKFINTNIIASGILLGIYLVVGFLTMLILRSSKWGSILGKTK